MNGTEWAEPGQGATIEELSKAILAQDNTTAALHVKTSENALAAAIRHNVAPLNTPSNLRLTGAPLTAYDLKRIEQCKVAK